MMKKVSWPVLLIFLLLTCSCDLFKVEDDEDNPDGVTNVNNLNEYIIGSSPKDSRQLTIGERDRGERVCQAFRSMRARINPYLDLTFTLSNNNCDNRASAPVTVSGRINSTANETPTMSERDLYFKDVYSDLHDHLKDVCALLLANEESSDTFKMDGITSIQVRFREVNGKTYVQVYEFIKSQLEFIHTIEVGMNSSTEGLNLSRILSRRCNTPGRVHSFTQNIRSIN